MPKRYLDCNASDLQKLNKDDLIYAIKASEGRVLISETIVITSPLLGDLTNAELAASQGADLLLLNMFDVINPQVQGLPLDIQPKQTIRQLQQLTGRLIGINLEAVDKDFAQSHNEIWQMTQGRLANAENAKKLVEMGGRFLVITGNPNNGVSNKAINQALYDITAAVGHKLVIIAGKMHGAGVVKESGQDIITQDHIANFIDNGADVILLPAPGTVPGMSLDKVTSLVEYIHSKNRLAMTAIGTSQEGADKETIRQIALMSKMAGADLHHIGDTGYLGIALPENIFTYSIAIRGRRHTYSRIARSINR